MVAVVWNALNQIISSTCSTGNNKSFIPFWTLTLPEWSCFYCNGYGYNLSASVLCHIQFVHSSACGTSLLFSPVVGIYIYLYIKGMCYGALTGFPYANKFVSKLILRSENVHSTLWVLYFEHLNHNSYKLLCEHQRYVKPLLKIIFRFYLGHFTPILRLFSTFTFVYNSKRF